LQRLATGLALASVTAIVGCGGSGRDGRDAAQPAKADTDVPVAVTKFADQLQGCLQGEASGPYRDGPIGQGLAGDLETKAVKAISNQESKGDFFVFRSKADAEAGTQELATFRARGGHTRVQGLLLTAYKDSPGDLGCVETARRAAGPGLADAPAAAPKLTAADRQTVLRASTVAEYCADKAADISSSAFASDGAAEAAVRSFLPLLRRTPDVEVKMQDNYTMQSPREVGTDLLHALQDGSCLGRGFTEEVERAH
jgi:hypothetical protein